jgi:hypothetical protein
MGTMCINTAPAASDEDNLGPVSSLKPWILELLKRPAVYFGTLFKHVETHKSWGVVGEVLRYRQLRFHTSDLCLYIEHLDAKLHGVCQAQMASQGCLEMAHLKWSIYEL